MLEFCMFRRLQPELEFFFGNVPVARPSIAKGID
jgi:hypothetical protein